MRNKFFTDSIPEGKEDEYYTEEQTKLLLGKIKRISVLRTLFIVFFFATFILVFIDEWTNLPAWFTVALPIAKFVMLAIDIICILFIVILRIDFFKTAKKFRK